MGSKPLIVENEFLMQQQADYSQNPLWHNLLQKVPVLRSTLDCFSQGISVNLGGLSHRERRSYSLSCCGFVYCILWVFLIITDIKLLQPVINGEIAKIGIE
jgi:hypothetical protein